MRATPIPAAGRPVRGVLFDLNSTLVHHGDAEDWLAAARRLMAAETAGLMAAAAPAGSAPAEVAPAEVAPDEADLDQVRRWADSLWEVAREIDPDNRRDLSAGAHREVFDETVGRIGGLSPALADAMYRTMLDQWRPYTETLEVLGALRSRGLQLGLISNVGPDPRPALTRMGLAGAFDVEVLSCEVGLVKPDPEIFAMAARGLGLPATDLLMVGDSVHDDGGAAVLGIRTLILPRTTGDRHGLEQVVRLIG